MNASLEPSRSRRGFCAQTAAALVALSPLSTIAAEQRVSSSKLKAYKIPRTHLTMSRVAYGSGYLGGTWDHNPLDAATIDSASHLIHTAIDNGITIFDLADVYCYGKSEDAFGKVLSQSRGLRDSLVIQSKCGIRWENEPQPGDPTRLDFSRAYITESVEGSLRRLRTEWLDILLLHHPDPLLRPEEVAEAFEALRRDGKVRYFGVSNYNARQIGYLRKWVREPLVINQVQLGLASLSLINEGMATTLGLIIPTESAVSVGTETQGTGTLEYCSLHDIQVQAYSPLRGVPLSAPALDAKPGVKRLAQTLADIAGRKGGTPSAVALAWLLAHPAKILTITEPRNPKHLIENVAADRISLSREEWYTLWIAALEAS
jgi:predicted oxidoreductase